LIRDRAIMDFAVAEQFHRRARRRAACDHGIARRLDSRDVERRDAVCAIRQWRRQRQRRCHGLGLLLYGCERGRSLIRRARRRF
jgi:hypothetical protein